MNKIEHNIPVPLGGKGRHAKYLIPFEEMREGDSYYIESVDYREIRNMQSSINTRARLLGYKITTRSDKGGLRIWVLETPPAEGGA